MGISDNSLQFTGEYRRMNDLEMYREQLALCDDKIIDALVDVILLLKRSWRIKKNMVCQSYSRIRKKNRREDWKKN